MSSVLDPIVGAIFLFIFGLVALIAYTVFTAISGTGLLGVYQAYGEQFFTAINNVAIFIAIGISMAAVFSGLLIRTHPAFFFLGLVIIFVEFMIVPSLVNSYNAFAQELPAATQNAFASQTAILEMLPILTAFGTMLTLIVGLIHE